MSTRFNSAGGPQYVQTGGHNSMVAGAPPAIPPQALRELEAAVRVLRESVSVSDRRVLDQSVSTVTSGTSDRTTMRTALSAIAGVAGLVTGVGAPVIGAVQAVLRLISD